MTEATGPKETITLTKPSHTSAKDIVLKSLSSNEQTGLTASQVTAAREKHGWNELATVAPEPAWKKFLAQFSDVMVWILIAAIDRIDVVMVAGQHSDGAGDAAGNRWTGCVLAELQAGE